MSDLVMVTGNHHVTMYLVRVRPLRLLMILVTGEHIRACQVNLRPVPYGATSGSSEVAANISTDRRRRARAAMHVPVHRRVPGRPLA